MSDLSKPVLPRCGRISYTNDLPVYTAFDDGVIAFPGTLVCGVPSELNRALLHGELDVSPVSSALFAQADKDLLLLPGPCIGAPAAARSVLCIANSEPASLAGKTVSVTSDSLSARTLLRVICRAWYGFEPVLVDSDDPLAGYLSGGTPCLLIGDRAVDAAQVVPASAVFDLGSLWQSLSGSGMIFAVWAVREDYARRSPDAVRAVRVALETSLDWGLENIERVVRRAQGTHPRPADFYGDYYRALNFRFDDAAQAALKSFFRVAAQAGVISRVPALRFFEQTPQHV